MTTKVATIIVPEGYVRKSFLPKYEVWMNVVPVGSGLRQNIKHEYEVWMNVVTEGSGLRPKKNLYLKDRGWNSVK